MGVTSDSPLGRHHVGTLLRALVVIVLAFLCALVLAGLGSAVLAQLGLVSGDGLAARVAVSVLQFLGFGVGVAGYLAVSRDWALLRVRVPTLRDALWIVGGVVAILVAAAAVGRVLSALGVQVAQNQVIVAGQQNPEWFLYMIPVSLLFVGPFEELVFRGGVQGLLRRAWGPAAAVVIAAALFGVVHWIALTGTGSRLSYVVVAATLGLILGAVYERTDNLAVPALVHGSYNSVLFAIQYASATGMLPG
jgi:hypothetical protein